MGEVGGEVGGVEGEGVDGLVGRYQVLWRSVEEENLLTTRDIKACFLLRFSTRVVLCYCCRRED